SSSSASSASAGASGASSALTSSSFSSGISSGFSSSSGLSGSIASGCSRIGSSLSSSGSAAFSFFFLGEPFVFFGFLGFFSLLVVYTLILVSLQFRLAVGLFPWCVGGALFRFWCEGPAGYCLLLSLGLLLRLCSTLVVDCCSLDLGEAAAAEGFQVFGWIVFHGHPVKGPLGL